MIDPLTHVIALLITIVITGITPHRHRPIVIAFSGIIFLTFFAPAATMFLFLSIAEAWLICVLVDRRPRSDNWRKYGPYLLLLNLFFVDFHSLLLGDYIQTVGVSFSLIRLFMTAKQLVSSRKDMRTEYGRWLVTATFYLPAIIIGPIFSGLDLRKQALEGEKPLKRISRTYRHMIGGLVLAVLVAPFFGDMIAPYQPSLLPRFLMLFAAFWGQSLIAENASRLMGYTIPQNFNKPWLASDIRDFWRRWHVSMAQFIMQYIYLPLTLRGVSPRKATTAAFLFMGLWHEVAPGYLLWGLGHGILMAYWPVPSADRPRWFPWAERTITFISVIVLSYVANQAFR